MRGALSEDSIPCLPLAAIECAVMFKGVLIGAYDAESRQYLGCSFSRLVAAKNDPSSFKFTRTETGFCFLSNSKYCDLNGHPFKPLDTIVL